MELYYINSEGEKLDFTKPPYLARNISELLDYNWSYAESKKKISGFSKQIAEIPITINVFADTEAGYITACNQLFEILEKDIIKRVNGRLYYNGQYVLCNIMGSKKKDWHLEIDFNLNYLKLITDYPFWIRETEYNFKYNDIFSGSNKKYAYRYPYRYANGLKDTSILNDHYDSVHFRMIMYGPCVNPQVNIEGHPYFVNTILETGEYLTVDSMKKTVIKTMMSGTEVNLFHYRGRNIFDRILPGRHTVSFGKFDFDLVLIRERSEPEWQ